VYSIKRHSLVGIGQKNHSIILFFSVLLFGFCQVAAVELFFNRLSKAMAGGDFIPLLIYIDYL
jgi:hypothetical protein